jgi:hypothetical protein
MLAGEGTTLPLDRVDARLGVMNHFSLGVPSIKAAVTTLTEANRLSPRHDGPQMDAMANGRPTSSTRIELASK